MLWDETIEERERAEFSMQAWLETERLEAAFKEHSCTFERSNRKACSGSLSFALLLNSILFVVRLGRNFLFG